MSCGVGDYLTQAVSAGKETKKNTLCATLMNKIPNLIFLTVKLKSEPHEIMDALKAQFGMSMALN
jgi:hypothetical protein